MTKQATKTRTAKALKTADVAGAAGFTPAIDAAIAERTAKAPAVLVKVTEPLRKAHTPREVSIPKGGRINRHHNDDGSITLYSAGLKVLRTATDDQIENGEVAEDYDAEVVIERFLAKWFGKADRKFGKVTHGNNWKNRKADAASADAPAAKAPAKAKKAPAAKAKAPAAKRVRKTKTPA